MGKERKRRKRKGAFGGWRREASAVEERRFCGRERNQTEEASSGPVSFHFLTPTSPFDNICMIFHCLLWTSRATGLVLG